MNPFVTGGIGFALNLQAKSKSAGRGECKPVIGLFRGIARVGKVGHLIRPCSISYVDDHVCCPAFTWYVYGANLNYVAHGSIILSSRTITWI